MRPAITTCSRRGLFRFGAGAVACTVLARSASAQVGSTTPPGAVPDAAAQGTVAPVTGNAFDMLSADHRRIEALLRKIQQTPQGAVTDRAALFAQLKNELTRHDVAEEYAVYPAIFQKANLRNNAKRLFTEQDQLKTMLFELTEMAKGDQNWMNGVNEFARTFADHVSEEEAQVFPAYRAMLDPNQMQELTRLVVMEKANVA